MFTAVIPTIDYRDPWDIPFERRMTALLSGSPRAAYYYARPDTSTFRYRAYNVSQALDGALQQGGGASASWFTEDDVDRMGRVLDACDVFVLCRNSLYSRHVAQVAALARARGRPVLFDVDDLVFDPAYTHLIMDTLAQDTLSGAQLDWWFGYIGRVGATFALCDGAIVTNDVLAARAEDWSGKPARVSANALNREQQEISDRIWDAKAASGWSRDGRLHLGYFSGSPSHNRDFAIVAGAIARLMDRDPSIWLRVVGFLDDNADLARHRHRIETVPLLDFMNLQREIGAVEINLVPLQDNDFTNCKSELKWFEAAIVGSLTIATPTYAYRGVIDHGRNGWLAGAHEWDAVLDTVVSGFSQTGAVRDAARADALARFGWQNQSAAIEAAVFGKRPTARSSRAPATPASPASADRRDSPPRTGTG